MGSPQRLAAVAAVSHSKYYYNNTHHEVTQTESNHYNVNIFFVSATLCGVLVAVCAACWRRSPASDKPEEVECHGVYTVSADCRLHQLPEMESGPPPAYESVVPVPMPPDIKDGQMLQEVLTEPCASCKDFVRCDVGKSDSELPSYEAAVMLRDTRL